ncbi:MAG: hypothetical protein HFI88_03420 [Lachnospiraceae bacterium]|nr:hypothetical protein [Lachnospiraceae bacterium]
MKKVMIPILSAGAGVLAGMAAGAGLTKKASNTEIAKEREMAEKHLALFLMMNRWVEVKQQGKSPADYLLTKKYQTIAIYGMSYAGERLVEELKNSGVTVSYGIDKKAGGVYSDMEVVSPEDGLREVDAVIVTSIFFMDEIEKALSVKLSCPVISLEDILYEL